MSLFFFFRSHQGQKIDAMTGGSAIFFVRHSWGFTMAAPTPVVSLSQSPLQDLIEEGGALVTLSAKGQFSRMKGDVLRQLFQTVEAQRKRLDEELSKQRASIDTLENLQRQQLEKTLKEHRADPNAHQYVKSRIGLSRVEDHPIASLDSDREGYVLASDVRAYVSAAMVAKKEASETQAVVLNDAARFRAQMGASIAIGYKAAQGGTLHPKDYIAIGHHVEPIAERSVQLGHNGLQVNLAKPIATRADVRDYRDPEPLGLGLDFVLKLHPQTARQDLREDYIDYSALALPPAPPGPAPEKPSLTLSEPGYSEATVAYRRALNEHEVAKANYRRLSKEWTNHYLEWSRQNDVVTLKTDGTHADDARRALLFADDLRQAAFACGGAFTGVCNAARIHEGLDIDTVRSEELIPVLVKALQDLHAYVTSDDYLEGLVERLYRRRREKRS